jgi:Fur family ferric uptake transcriptional regulator
MGVVRKTKSIELLLNEFKNQSTALSTIELIKRLNSKLNKTTIYRVLENLVDDGILHTFIGQDGIKWYCSKCTKSKYKDVNPHFQCMECGEIDCLNTEVVIPEIQNRKIVSSQILIQGKCEKCTN